MRRSLSNGVSNEELLITPASIFSRLIRDVQHARRSIDVEFYIFELDNVGRSFAMLLARKARQGLAVRLLLDGFGSRMISSSLCRELRESGVELSISSKFANSRNHRKMCLISAGQISQIDMLWAMALACGTTWCFASRVRRWPSFPASSSSTLCWRRGL